MKFIIVIRYMCVYVLLFRFVAFVKLLQKNIYFSFQILKKKHVKYKLICLFYIFYL